MPDIDTLRTHSLFGKIIRPICSALDMDFYDFFPIFLDGFVMKKHGNIRFNRIPDHVADLQRSAIRVI